MIELQGLDKVEANLSMWSQEFEVFSKPMGKALKKLEEVLEVINKRLMGESERALIYEMNKKCRPFEFKKTLAENYSQLLK